ncbi:MAG: uroporphyrinogen-III synthase [Calditrichaceae bacterium]
MSSLSGKKILICRGREQSLELDAGLREKGSDPVFFAPFTVDIIDPNKEMAIERELKNLDRYDLILFGSPNGVSSFRHYMNRYLISDKVMNRIGVGIVGNKAAKRFERLFPKTDIRYKASSLKDLLEKTGKSSDDKKINILNLTSEQSLLNIQLEIPDNISLVRLPIYKTVANTEIDENSVGEINKSKFDMVVFSSPSSYDYFVGQIGKAFLMSGISVAAFGKTTAGHIKKNGFKADVVPVNAETDNLIMAIEAFFDRINSGVITAGG